MYYRYVDFMVRGLAADAKSLIDVGSADARYIEEFTWIPERDALDIKEPYGSESVTGIEMDFFDFEPEEKYDFATCLQVLEHIPDAEAFARKLFQTARRVLISVPYLWEEGSTESHVHDPVNEDKLLHWTGREPDYSIVVQEPLSERRRLISYYHPEGEKLHLGKARRNVISSTNQPPSEPKRLTEAEALYGDPARELAREQEVHSTLEHLHGPEEVPYERDELIVVCPVRDGEPWVRAFIEHHFSLGVRHVVLLDNGSEDGTVAIAREYEGVTVLRTMLPFKTHKLAFKRYLIKRFGKGRWVLCLDMDEMFDYPYSDAVGLRSLLEYLDRGSYTALVTYTLDRFPEEPLLAAAKDTDKSLKELHDFYDISNVTEQKYRREVSKDNAVSNEEISVPRGGIQSAITGTSALLIRYPLTFVDDEIEIMNTSIHWVNNARIADFTGVIFHYRFAGDLHKYAARAAREESHGGNSARYKKYLEVLEETPDLQIKRETSKRLGSVNDLVDEQFLAVSEDYMTWVDEKESENPPPEVLRERPYRLGEAFSRARVKAPAVTEAERSDRRRIANLKNEIAEEQRRAEALRRRQRKMAARLQSMKASRGWRLLLKLGRIRNRLLKALPSRRSREDR